MLINPKINCLRLFISYVICVSDALTYALQVIVDPDRSGITTRESSDQHIATVI